MGYYINQEEADFTILRENQAAALQAIKDMFIDGKHYMWINDSAPEQWDTLSEAMRDWSYVPFFDTDTGDIVDIGFSAEKAGDEDKMFKAIAPFVESGSFIWMLGEDGCQWKWVFKDGEFEEKHARLVWD